MTQQNENTKLICATSEHFEKLYPVFAFWLKAVNSGATKEDAEKEYQRILNEGTMIFIEEKDDIAGFICGRVCYHFWLNEKVAHEYLWFVSPFYRGEGFGPILIHAFEAWALAHGCKSVVITPNKFGSDNPERGKHVLEKINYETYGYQMRKELNYVRRDDNAGK